MARTRASVAAKVASGKSSKATCSAAPPPSSNRAASGSSGEKSSKSFSGGNPVCPRETPKWQKPITNFFLQNHQAKNQDDTGIEAKAGSSKSKSRRNVIHSDDESEHTDTPKNKVSDETIELEPLNGEDSHKINEYYAKRDADKEESDKENIDGNAKRNKRSLEEVDSNSDDLERNNKKIKVD